MRIHRLFLFPFCVFHGVARLAEFGVPDDFFKVLVVEAARGGSEGRDTGVVRRESGKERSNRYGEKPRECVQIPRRRFVLSCFPSRYRVWSDFQSGREPFLTQRSLRIFGAQLSNLVADVYVKRVHKVSS